MPDRVGRYEPLLPIASGGMATVYLARAVGIHGFERSVALKVTHAHLREQPEFALDLIEEAKMTAGVRHPNVVPVLDVGDDPLGVYLVMEYIEGDSLSFFLRHAVEHGSRLPLGIGFRILIDALSGLHAAHEAKSADGGNLGLVHRDFTPQNILVGVDGIARLADFGIAKAVTRLGHTATGLVKGKVSYMAPEQARGEPVDRRCDIWAAGVIAWELVAWKRLHASGEAGTLFKIATQPPPRLSSVVPNVDPALERAISGALTMDPAERTQSAQQLARALRDALGPTLADSEQVAAHVADAAGEKLRARAARVEQVRELRAEMVRLTGDDSDVARASTSPPLPARASGADSGEAPSIDITETNAITRPRGVLSAAAKRKRIGLFALLAAAPFVLAAAVIVLRTPSPAPAPERATAAAVTTSAAPRPQPTASLEPTPSLAPTGTAAASASALVPTAPATVTHKPIIVRPRVGPKPKAKQDTAVPLPPSPY